MKIRPIRTNEDLAIAKKELALLLAANDVGKKDDEIEVLSILIEQFERRHYDIEAPSPIAAIRFRMEEMKLSARQLEPFIGSRARVSEVLTGKRSLSIDMIRSLHDGLGIPYASLMSERPKRKADEVSTSAIAHLSALGFTLEDQDISAFVRSSLPGNNAPALLRKSRSQRATLKTDQSSLMLWKAAAIKGANKSYQSAQFDQRSLSTAYLRRIAMLSTNRNGPLKAIESLAQRGVSVVVVPPLPGTYLDGAVMLNNAGVPVVGLTIRHDRVDSFWFTLLHELAHIKLHYEELRRENFAFIDDIEIQSDEVQECEADELARVSLIPDTILAQVPWTDESSVDHILAVASRARVHVSIVAGRWQRDHKNYRKFARLIKRNTLRPMLLRGQVKGHME